MADNGGLSIWIEGRNAATFGYGALGIDEVEHRYSVTGGGLHLVRFNIALPRRTAYPTLIEGARVQVRRGPVSLGWARLTEVDLDTGEMAADGDYRRAEDWPALIDSPALATSTNLRQIVTWGNTTGLGWGTAASLPNTTLSATIDTTQGLVTIAQLLNEYARLNGLNWWLDGDNVPKMAAAPTTPTVTLFNGVPGMPTAADDYANRVALRYTTRVSDHGTTDAEPVPVAWKIITATSTDAPHGDRWYTEDISELGLLEDTTLEAEATAETYLGVLLAERAPRYSFAAGVEVRPDQVASAGGVTPAPWVPLHGRRVRHQGVRSKSGAWDAAGTLEWIVGRSTYRPADGTRILEPTELTDRTFSQLMPRDPERGVSRTSISRPTSN